MSVFDLIDAGDKDALSATAGKHTALVDLEGVIAAGEYGGGDVIVWDWGAWEPEAPTLDPRRAIDDVESHREPPAASLAHPRVLGGDIAQSREEPSSREGYPSDDMLLLDGPKHRERCGARGGAAAERAEVVGGRDEGVDQVRWTADCSDRVPVAHRLAQRHQVSRSGNGRHRDGRAGGGGPVEVGSARRVRG